MTCRALPQTDPTRETWQLWPHRSLTPRGFAVFIGLTSALFGLPLILQLGTAALWVLLPFAAATVAGTWVAIRHSYRTVSEELELAPDLIRLTRHEPGGKDRRWQANPHWVRVRLHASGGPVPQYLTLTGAGRTVELGAFLTVEERVRLHDLLQQRLIGLRIAPPPT